MSLQLGDSCVYTIATVERLREASNFQMPLHELKRWVSAAKHLENTKKAGLELPIVFADSRDCSNLIAWSVLRSVTIVPKGTYYTIGRLWAVPTSHPQDLRLLSSKKHIAEGFIRPYALCQTPDFLHIESNKPRIWLLRNTNTREAREGKRRMEAHMRLERNQGLVNELKKQRMKQHDGRLPCEICGFDFLETYGPVGAGFAEAHHKKSLASSPKAGRITSLDDFIVVCANCHRMLHRTPELPNVESLKRKVRSSAKTTQ